MSTSDDFAATTTTIQTLIADRRPWPQFFNLTTLNLPPLSLHESTARISRNLLFFRVNYAIIVLLALFLSLIYHPLSMIVFLIIFVAWFFLYFFRSVPLTILDRSIDDRAVVAFLGVVTVVALVLTGVWLNVMVSCLFGGVIVCVHGVVRSTDDLVWDDRENPFQEMLSNVLDEDDDDDSSRRIFGDI